MYSGCIQIGIDLGGTSIFEKIYSFQFSFLPYIQTMKGGFSYFMTLRRINAQIFNLKIIRNEWIYAHLIGSVCFYLDYHVLHQIKVLICVCTLFMHYMHFLISSYLYVLPNRSRTICILRQNFFYPFEMISFILKG